MYIRLHTVIYVRFAGQDLEAMKRSLLMFCFSLSTIQNIPSMW